MIEKEKTESINIGAEPAQNQPNNRPTQNKTDRMYQIACSFPALRHKGAVEGDIPGVRPNGFYDTELHDFLYKGDGGVLSSGEFLLLEFLLNLYNPHEYPQFNFGCAVNVLDWDHMWQCLQAVPRIYNGE